MSQFFNLNLLDLLKGFILACLTVLLGSAYDLLVTGVFPDGATLVKWGAAALAAGLAYLIKNLFTNSLGIPFKSEK